MSMTERNSISTGRRPLGLLLWILVVAVALGLAYFLSTLIIPTPKIGVIRLDGEINDSVADYVVAQANHARNDPSIRAVVLKVNSPGGGVTPSENLHYSLLSLREQKPLVVSIDTMAASGGYYAASAGDVIYAKPSSSVGNIGVVSLLPSQSFVDEELIATGPMKLFGTARDSYIREMEILKQGFLRAVETQRKKQLKVGPDVLSRGELYVGVRALDVGLIDRLGTVTDAIEKAAEMAKVAHYETVDLSSAPSVTPPASSPLNELPVRPSQSKSTGARGPQSGLYYLSIAGQEGMQ
jgi:protease IV